MPNMLKQFYKYLIRKTVDHFEDNLNQGERYFIQFEEKEDVNEFYNVISNDSRARNFEYNYEDEEKQYNTYRTKYIEVNGKKLIIAATVNDITPNYLIILRNMLDEKVEEFENASILFIFDEEIDSILGGAKNLLEEGQPLYIGQISNNLKDDMKSSDLKKHEEEILKFHLNNISNKNNEQAFIWDLEEVLSFIEKGEIDENEYKKFNLFPDPALSGFNRNKMQDRLKRNNEIYEMVESIQINRDAQSEIEEKFDAKGAKKLAKDNWEINKFNDLKKSLDNKNNFTPLEYMESNDKELNNEIIYWEKPESTTKAGARKRHIIVFNKNKVKNYTLEFEFDQKLSNEFISSTSQNIAETNKGKKLKININNADETKFERAIYTHNDKTHSKYKFYIVNLPFAEEALEDIKTDYFIKATSQDQYIKIEEKFDGFNISRDFNIKSENDKINIETKNKDHIISFNEDLWIKDELEFQLFINNYKVPFLVKDKNKKIVPKSSDWIWNSKRENKSHFELIDNKVRLNNQDFYLHSAFKKYLDYEEYMVKNDVVFADIEAENINKIDIALPNEIEKNYMKLLDYFNENNFLPSLVYIDEELKSLIEEFIISFIDAIKGIDNNEILSPEKINLFKIGVIRNHNKLLLSPLHPLNLIYQLKVIEDLDHEKVDSKILKQLNPANLLPYIIHNNTKYKPVSQNDAREWLVYKKINNLNSEDSYDYISQIIDEKIEQFYKHFNFIFKGKNRPSIKINIINVEKDLNILRGIINNILVQLKNKDLNKIPKFEVKFYNQNNKNSFDKFFSLDNPEELEEFLDLKLNVQAYSKYDIMLAIRDSIKYYFVENENNNFHYAHLSFYEFKKEEKFGYYEIDKLDSGLSMEGLKASVKSGFEDNDYRMGFGLKGFNEDNNLLVKTAKYLNELNRNLDNYGKNPYSKGETLVSLYSIDKEEEIKEALNQSIWVTFINPIVDIDFFQGIDNKTIVLHYSDQYTNFDNLDAITITNKSDQYSDIIKRFLAQYDDSVFDDEVVKNTINIFNSVNGEWLLNILSENSDYTRSKLSEIASIKYLLAFLEKEEILWVPISLEEILRIAGIAGLKKENGLFSAKSLDVKGEMSDDILFLGVNISNNPLELFIYPVEVKVGNNNIIKGKKQVNKTYKILRENLRKKKDSDRLLFINKFYRNFFMQLFVSNFKNMVRLDIFDESSLDKLENIKNNLANDDFIISDKLIDRVGKGTVISFEKDLSYSACILEDDINILRFSERHVYTGLSQKVHDIRKRFLKDNYDIKSTDLLSKKMDDISRNNNLKENIDIEKDNNTPKSSSGDIVVGDEASIEKVNEEINNKNKNTSNYTEEISNINQKENENYFEEEREKINLNDIRLYIGNVRGSKKKIFWEYGHAKLPNRHLLISGKSGQGKTYLIETLLYELSKKNISSLIIDYTDGFKSNQLESQFKDLIGNKLNQFYLIRDKIGINPFKMNEIVLDENYTRKEKPYDVAERIKTVISAIYSSLGIQQLNTIYNAVQSGVEEYGEEMDFDILKQKLIEDESGYSDTALSQLNSFFNQHPFKFDKDFSWEEIDKNNGNVNVIQLSGFSQDIQMLITEFLLWDLWYYKKQNGTEEKPLPLVIDEAQNLDHSSKSPTAKILTEGRKFGFSGIFSTQFLQGQLSKDEISRLQMASQKIYFKPPDNEMNSIAADFDDKNRWKQELKKLVKGRCINKGHIYNERQEKLLEVQSMVLDVASFQER